MNNKEQIIKDHKEELTKTKKEIFALLSELEHYGALTIKTSHIQILYNLLFDEINKIK